MIHYDPLCSIRLNTQKAHNTNTNTQAYVL
jgi:hypothetical protein